MTRSAVDLALRNALGDAAIARLCLRGQPDDLSRDQAREGYEHAVGELTTAVIAVLDSDTLRPRAVERVARQVLREIEKSESRL